MNRTKETRCAHEQEEGGEEEEEEDDDAGDDADDDNDYAADDTSPCLTQKIYFFLLTSGMFTHFTLWQIFNPQPCEYDSFFLRHLTRFGKCAFYSCLLYTSI